MVVPPGDVTVRCGDERRKWAEGDSIIFDDSFEHCVDHNGDRPRTVLLMNFWHPEFPERLRTPEWRTASSQAGALAKYDVKLG